jgi:cytochrome c oxidase subunit 3
MSARLALVEPYRDSRQQQEAARLGMWLFLITEVMLFGGLFMGILVYRVLHGSAFAEASSHLDLWLGGLNTAVLLTSSLMMALAVHAAREGERQACIRWLLLTALLGLVFLGIKGYEYWKEYHEGLMPGVGPDFPMPGFEAQLFFNLYFASTGLHALHLTLGIGTVALFAGSVAGGWLRLPCKQSYVEGLGLYWHLVDVIWVFLYPVLYLI